MSDVISLELLLKIKEHYLLEWWGIHGVLHWQNVFLNASLLSKQEGVRTRVCELFSIFHDSQRIFEGRDNGHGKRGANLAFQLREYIPLDDEEFNLLLTACTLHTSTTSHDNITVQVCIDSDRLDLGRVCLFPDKNQLLSPMAKRRDIIEQCYERSISHELPEKPFGLDRFWEVFGGDDDSYDPYLEWTGRRR